MDAFVGKGEVEFGIINILDSNMAATGTGNYKKAYPTIRIVAGGVFPFTGSIMVRDKSEIKTAADLKGKRMAWDFGGHAITQTWQNAAMEVLRAQSERCAASALFQLERRDSRACRKVKSTRRSPPSVSASMKKPMPWSRSAFSICRHGDASNKILAKYGGVDRQSKIRQRAFAATPR